MLNAGVIVLALVVVLLSDGVIVVALLGLTIERKKTKRLFAEMRERLDKLEQLLARNGPGE